MHKFRPHRVENSACIKPHLEGIPQKKPIKIGYYGLCLGAFKQGKFFPLSSLGAKPSRFLNGMDCFMKSKFSKLVSSLFLLLVGTAAQTEINFQKVINEASDAKFQYSDKLLVEKFYRTEIENLLSRESKTWKEVSGASRTYIKVQFDEQRLQSDHKNHIDVATKKFQDYQASVNKSFSKIINELESQQKTIEKEVLESSSNDDAAKSKNRAVQEMLRFGDLNIDISDDALKKIVDVSEDSLGDGAKSVTNQFRYAPQFAISVPSPELNIKPFVIDIRDYVAEVSILVELSSAAPQGIEDRLKEKIVQKFHLQNLAKSDEFSKWIKFSRIQEQEAEATDTAKKTSLKDQMLNWVVSPNNHTFAIILATILLGLSLLYGMKVMVAGFQGIAKSINDFGSITQSAFGEKSKDKDVVDDAQKEEAALPPLPEAPNGLPPIPGMPVDSKSDDDALVASLDYTREQIEGAITEDAALVAEILIDILYENGGPHQIASLIGFLGYSKIKPALAKFAQTKLAMVQEFIEDSEQKASVFKGAEVAQKVLKLYMAKATGNVHVENEYLKLKDMLLKVEDTTLRDAIEELSGDEVSIILKALTQSRSNWLVDFIPTEKLKSALDRIDDVMSKASELVPNITQKLDQIASSRSVLASKDRLRFLVRMARVATPDTETDVDALVDQDDWGVRIPMMQAKLFYQDLRFVPLSAIKKNIDHLKMKQKAEFFSLSSGELRTHLLTIFPEQSRIREMMDSELNLIENNPRRTKEIQKRKNEIIADVLGRIQDHMNADQEVFDEIIQNKCSGLGLNPPQKNTSSVTTAA